MSFKKIQIEETAVSSDIIKIFSVCEEDHLVFIFPNNSPLLSESKFIKNLKTAEKKHSKTFSIISRKKFFRETLKKFSVETFLKIPQKWTEGEKVSVSEILFSLDFETGKSQKKNAKNFPEKEESSLDSDKKTEEDPSFPSFKTSPVKKNKIPSRSKIFFGILVFFLFSLFLFFWKQPHAVITITPKIDILPILQNFLVVLPEAKIDQSNKQLPIVPAVFIQTTIKDTEIIPTSGREYEVTNGRGKITLYNETEKPKFLIPSRLQDPNGIIVRFKKEITIPPKKNNKPGEIIVEVEVDEFDEKGRPIGIRGNIDAGTEFVFIALREELQELYYGKANKGPLIGGSTLTKYVIKESDEEISKQKVLENFRDRGIQNLTKQIEELSKREKKNYILLENQNLLVAEIKDFLFPKDLIGTEQQTIPIPAEVKVSGIVFDQDSINSVIRNQSKKLISDREKIVKIDESSIEYEILDKDEDFEENKFLKLSVKIIGIQQVNINSKTPKVALWREILQKKIAGLSEKEAISILSNTPEIENIVDINIRPFWTKKIPKKIKNISFKSISVE